MKNKGRMEKSIYTREYAAVLRLLKNARESAGITQVQLAERLGQTQSFVSKIERGERRLDIVQLRTILKEFDVSLAKFIEQFESAIEKRG
jgi:transcriptional regulator with XRE-family HTH domain